MKTNLVKPSRVNFEKADIGQIGRILATGDLDSLPEEQRAYYDLMEMVRGLRARMRYNGKVITKAGIIRLLKSEVYGLSDWMARRLRQFLLQPGKHTSAGFCQPLCRKAGEVGRFHVPDGQGGGSLPDTRAGGQAPVALRM